MYSEEVERKDGSKVTVTAQNKEDLSKAVEAQKGMTPATYPNINVPVEKGKDLVEVDEALNVNLVDGRGAHNSPNDAVNEDGSLAGDPKVASPGAGESPLKAADSGAPVGDPTIPEPEESDKKPDSESKTDSKPAE